MTTYVKPTVRSAWGEAAPGADLQDPGDIFAKAGWQIGVKPPRQYFNWVLYFASAAVRYFCQNGITAWDVAETYSSGAVILGPDNRIYQSLQNNNIAQTPASSATFWAPAKGATPANGDNSNALATTAFVNSGFIAKGSNFSALSGAASNAQVPFSAVQQWQGSLSIAFSQITGVLFPGQVPLGVVSQHQGSLAIAWSQLTGTKNADQLNGVVGGPSGTWTGNTYARYNNLGELFASHFNQSSSNSENPSVNQFIVTNGADSYFRKADIATVKAALGALSVADFPNLGSTNGFQKFPTGIIIQWGTVTVGNGTNDVIDVGVTYPIAFPNVCTFCGVTTQRSVGGSGQAIHGSDFATPTRSGATLSIDSSGGGSSTARWFAVGF